MKNLTEFFFRVVDQVLGKAILASLVVLMGVIATQAQNEANNWIFGNHAGLTFPSAGNPVAYSGGTPAIATLEGSSSISDQNGALLFYTDGVTVWNRNHAPMLNGSGLMGFASSTQSALIVPRPGTDCKQYYVFTVDAQEDNLTDTLRYSVVDMTLAGGLGDVVAGTKNIALKTPVSEKLAAVRDSAGTGFWVVAHGYSKPTTAVNREFYAYHIDASGLNITPVISTVGTPHDNNALPTKVPSSGQMKISPDGRLIACAVNGAFVEILDFHTHNGTVTQGPPRLFRSTLPPFQHISTYGLEFSPNSGFLYVTTIVAPSRLFQLEISNSNWTLMATAAAGTATSEMAQLQLGPDNRIYVARNNRSNIGVINSPGVGASYTATGPALPSGSTSGWGLPTMIGGAFSCAPTPTPTLDCCDKLAALPYTQPNLDIDYRTFTITNLKAPVSPICSVDIVFNPPPPFVVGGGLHIDNNPIPTGTRFVSPYNRIPNAGAATISAVNTVQFNLGVDYTLNPPWVGTVTFTVNHCDGSKCTLNYGPWTARPPRTPGDPINYYDSTLRLEGNLHVLTFQLKGQERRTPIKWISFMVAESKGQIFAGAGSFTGENRGPSASIVATEDAITNRTSVLYAFGQPLRSGVASSTLDLVLRRDASATGPPVIIWTTYDPDGNAVDRGRITSRRVTSN